MSCTCRIGGNSVCGFCRSQNEQAKRNSDLQQQLLRLADRVVKLEETVLAQAAVIDGLVEHMRSSPQKASP